MFRVLADDICIYNDAFALPESRAVSPKLIMEASAAGSLTITLPKENAGYGTVERLTTDISVERLGEVIWAGRIINDRKDFWNNRVLTCEGEFAFFNDSVQPPHDYLVDANQGVRTYLEDMIEIHNAHVPENRRFRLGAVTVHEKLDTHYYTNDEKTLDRLNDLHDRLGGYFRVRHENGERILDYLEGCAKASKQTIQFGRNLIEFTRSWDSTEYATAILPLGGRLSSSPIEALDAYLTIESVNEGSRYIQNDAAVEAYGWIVKVVRWDDITDPAKLKEMGNIYLSELQFDNMQIELSALDLQYVDHNIQAVEILDEIRVISRPHGLDRYFPVTKLEIPLDEPENAKFNLGDSVKTALTQVNNETNAHILKVIDELPKAHTILKTAKENSIEIMNMATTGYISLLKDEHGSESLAITPDRISRQEDLSRLEHYWLWNANGLGYFRDYGKDVSVAITMDGSISANFITTGEMSADRITTGLLRDPHDNVVFNLNEGTLTIRKGHIALGMVRDPATGREVPNFEVDNDGNLIARSGTFYGKLVGATGTFGGSLQAATGDFQGSLTIGDGKFRVYGDGSMSVANDAFAIDNQGNVTITKGSINIGSGAFVVDRNGNLTAEKGTFKGAININDNFVVQTDGSMKAVNGDFSGTLRAANIVGTLSTSEYGSISSGGMSISGGDLVGGALYIPNKSYPKFAVDAQGNVTMSGSINMSQGSITFSSDFQNKIDEAGETAKKIANGTYKGGTFISGTTIYSAVIVGGELRASTQGNCSAKVSSDGFYIYDSRYSQYMDVFRITYASYDSYFKQSAVGIQTGSALHIGATDILLACTNLQISATNVTGLNVTAKFA